MDTTFTLPVTASHSLRRALRADGLFSGIGGILSIILAQPLAVLTGLRPPAVLVILGVGLLGYAALLLWTTARPPIDRRLAITAIVLNEVWVLASVAILLSGWPPLTTAGKWLIGLVAIVVADFSLWQFIALRRLNRSNLL